MPVNNWIPVAQQFGQFLEQQSDRRKKLMQRSMMQQLPGYIASELSDVKSQEDVYKKLPELSARMFAIDPEIGATATQIANQYGQMKLQQIQQGEKERTAKEGLEVFKQNFGTIPVTQNGKVVMFKDVIDNMTQRGMSNEDILGYGKIVLEQAAVKQQRLFNYGKGKSILTEWQVDNAGRVVGEGKKYQIDNIKKRMDDLSTEGFDNLELLPEAAAGYAEVEELRRRTDEQLNKQSAYDNIRRQRDLETMLMKREKVNLTLKDNKIVSGYAGYDIVDVPAPTKENPNATKKAIIEKYYDNDGKDISNQVAFNKIYASQVNMQFGSAKEKEYWIAAVNSAKPLLSEIKLNDNIINELLLEDSEMLRSAWDMYTPPEKMGFDAMTLTQKAEEKAKDKGYKTLLDYLYDELDLNKAVWSLSNDKREKKAELKRAYELYSANKDNFYRVQSSALDTRTEKTKSDSIVVKIKGIGDK